MTILGPGKLERISIGNPPNAIEMMINPETISYSYSVQKSEVVTLSSVIYQMGPELPATIKWSGKTSKNAKKPLEDLWKMWKRGNQHPISYINPHRGERYKVIVDDFDCDLDWKSPYRHKYSITFKITSISSSLQLGTYSNTRMENKSDEEIKQIENTIGQYTIRSGDTWESISKINYGSSSFAGKILRTCPHSAISQVGDPIPGEEITLYKIKDQSNELVDVDGYYIKESDEEETLNNITTGRKTKLLRELEGFSEDDKGIYS